MATLTIRNLDDTLKASLRVRAARHGQSMEEEVRSILRQALSEATPATGLGKGFGKRLASRFQATAGDLPILQRSPARMPPSWDASA